MAVGCSRIPYCSNSCLIWFVLPFIFISGIMCGIMYSNQREMSRDFEQQRAKEFGEGIIVAMENVKPSSREVVLATNATEVKQTQQTVGSVSVPPESRKIATENTGKIQAKSWPAVDSLYPPWPWPPSLAAEGSSSFLDGCEAAWGSGFTELVSLHGDPPSGRFRMETPPSTETFQKGAFPRWSSSGVQGSALNPKPPFLRCLHSPTLRTSICEGSGLVLNPSLIPVSLGNESLPTVMGRSDEVEFPGFRAQGAFQVLGDKKGSEWKVDAELAGRLYSGEGNAGGYWRDALMGMRQVAEVECATVLHGPTLAIIRFEYVNPYHTTTDWHTVVTLVKMLGLEGNVPRVVFLDGHAQGNLDPVWHTLFSGVHFAKHLAGPVCFEHLIFVPLGYTSPIFQIHKGYLGELSRCHGGFVVKQENGAEHVADLEGGFRRVDHEEAKFVTPRSIEFADTFVRAFGISRDSPSYAARFLSQATHRRGEEKAAAMRVLFVRREFFIAHPRNTGGPTSRLDNELEVFTALQNWATKRAGLASPEELELEEVQSRDPDSFATVARGSDFVRPEILRTNSSSMSKGRIYLIHGRLTNWPFYQQLEAAYLTDVWIGAHGAGLTHLQYCRPGTHIVEVNCQDTQYRLMSQFRGLPYHEVNGNGQGLAENLIQLLETIAVDVLQNSGEHKGLKRKKKSRKSKSF